RAAPSPRPPRAKARPPAPATPPPPPPASTAREHREVGRRALRLTPLEASRFDPAHPLAGAVVVVEVPFDGVDPDAPEATAKARPALVVAGAPAARGERQRGDRQQREGETCPHGRI
ncbi:MAG TPA: hypothetical protein PLS29_02700, partial [Acidimicrobiales bacterium]|nr:hypothetical protein [Acidimicrobiales bacterium]